MQPDTIVPDAKNPQALNRYAYGLNNPLRYVDPSGYLSQDQIDGYLKQTYGKDWQSYQRMWEGNKTWWAAISAAQPGDYLGAQGHVGRLQSIGNSYTIVSDEGRTTDTLAAWSTRGVDTVLHHAGLPHLAHCVGDA